MSRRRRAEPELEEHVSWVDSSDGFRLALTELRLPGQTERVIDAAPPPPVFLLVHGFAQNRHAFTRGAMPRLLLERGARVMVAELRGHGRSAPEDPKEPRTWSLETHLEEDLPALVGHAASLGGVPRLHLVGHSMGGILGYAFLARSTKLLSLTTLQAPLHLGRDRPLLRLASIVAEPVLRVGRPDAVPMDYFLRALAPILTMPGSHTGRVIQRLTGLANPHLADPDVLREILSTSDPESAGVARDLAEMAVMAEPRLAGIDLLGVVRASPIPIAAVHGAGDAFTSKASLAGLDDPAARGPRLVLELPGALHVDLLVGHHAERVVAALWDFVRLSA